MRWVAYVKLIQVDDGRIAMDGEGRPDDNNDLASFRYPVVCTMLTCKTNIVNSKVVNFFKCLNKAIHSNFCARSIDISSVGQRVQAWA